MNKRHIFGISIITIVIIFSVVSFKNSVTPYVTFAEAKQMNGNVQVRGVFVSEQAVIIEGRKIIKITLLDEKGEQATIIYKGMKPEGLEQATGVIAIGRYSNDQFIADKLLTKCPSKYQSATGSVNNK